jgi:hypothetical protein
MDLPLATPELDHDALRETLSSCSMTVRDEGYSPPPTGSWKPVFFVPSKEVCTSNSIVTYQPCLSSCKKNLLMASCAQNELISLFCFEPESYMCSILFSRSFSPLYFLADLPLPLNYFLSLFLSKVSWVQIPNSWSGLEALQMGTLPHLLINS